jgi:hypothetical protein
MFPLIRPSLGGSTVFVYHGAAVGQFWTLVLTPFVEGLSKSVQLPVSCLAAGTQSSKSFMVASYLAEVTCALAPQTWILERMQRSCTIPDYRVAASRLSDGFWVIVTP